MSGGERSPRILRKISSRDHGDARLAIELLRKAGEIGASRNFSENPETLRTGQQNGELGRENEGPALTGTRTPTTIRIITKDDVDAAYSELKKDKITSGITSLPEELMAVYRCLVRISYLTGQEWNSTTVLYGQYQLTGWLPSTYDGGLIDTAADSRELTLSRRRFSEKLAELRNAGLISSQTKSEGRHGYKTKYALNDDPASVGKLCFGSKWWYNIVDLKQKRENFLGTKLFQKVFKVFEKNGDHEYETVLSEMNDHNWNHWVYGQYTAEE